MKVAEYEYPKMNGYKMLSTHFFDVSHPKKQSSPVQYSSKGNGPTPPFEKFLYSRTSYSDQNRSFHRDTRCHL